MGDRRDKMLVTRLTRAGRIFLSPGSPAAVYRNPQRLVKYVLARGLNGVLRLRDRVAPCERVTCIVCGRSGACFGYTSALSVDHFRGNDVCLGCGANLRTRRALEVMGEVVELSEPRMVIDVGATPATREFFRRRPRLTYRTIDPFREDSDIKCSVTDIELADEVADVVLCSHVLEHVREDRAGIREMRRILKRGGVAILMVPQRAELAETRPIAEEGLDGYGHVWEYGEDFPRIVAECGLSHVASPMCPGSGPLHVFRKEAGS